VATDRISTVHSWPPHTATRRLLAAAARLELARRADDRHAVNAARDAEQAATIDQHIALDWPGCSGDSARNRRALTASVVEAARVGLHPEGIGDDPMLGLWVWTPHDSRTLRAWVDAGENGEVPAPQQR
jgi:hypothetical protein